MSVRECYDTALIGILQNEVNIVNFVDVFFSFLYRKTDFFRIMLSPTDKYGFQPGAAKKLILAAFKRYESLASELNTKLKAKYEQALAASKAKDDSDNNNSDMIIENVVAEEVVVVADDNPTSQQRQQQNQRELEIINEENEKQQSLSSTCATNVVTTVDATTDNATTTTTSTINTTTTTTTNTSNTTNTIITPTTITTTTTTTTTDTNTTITTKTLDPKIDATNQPTNQNPVSMETNEAKKNINPDDDPDLERQQKIFQANPESYNGAIRDRYRWSQSILDLDIRVKVPPFVKKGKDVSVEILKKRIKVSYAGHDNSISGSGGCGGSSSGGGGGSGWSVAVDGELSWEVHKDESTWSLVPGDHVHISLEKVQERWWNSLLTDEPKISVRKIDPSRPITDLDDESQAKVEEMMYNERQKRLGLPQSHEKNMHEILKKAWDAEGSPFKGQPFDPSKVNIAPGSNFGTGSI